MALSTDSQDTANSVQAHQTTRNRSDSGPGCRQPPSFFFVSQSAGWPPPAFPIAAHGIHLDFKTRWKRVAGSTEITKQTNDTSCLCPFTVSLQAGVPERQPTPPPTPPPSFPHFHTANQDTRTRPSTNRHTASWSPPRRGHSLSSPLLLSPSSCVVLSFQIACG
jgi:hypothetical protein